MPFDTGFDAWLWWYSLINSGGIGGDPGETDGAEAPAISDSSLVIDPVAETIEVMADVVDPGEDAMVIVRMSRPTPPGRSPAPNTTRVVAVVPVGETTDVAAEYESRFGSLPAGGTRVLGQLRVGDPDARSATPVTDVIAEVEVPVVSVELSVTNTGGDIEPEQSGEVTFELIDPDAGEEDKWDVVLLTDGWDMGGEQEIDPNEESSFDLEDTDGTERTELVEFRATKTTSPFTQVEGSAEFTVTEEA